MKIVSISFLEKYYLKVQIVFNHEYEIEIHENSKIYNQSYVLKLLIPVIKQ